MYSKAAGTALLIISMIASLSLCPYGAFAFGQAEAREIVSGEVIEREIAAGETHSFRISMVEGQYLCTFVKGEEINLLVQLNEPGGEKVFERSRNHRLRPEDIFALARQPGDYILTVSATLAETRGRYTIRIEDLRIALPDDHNRVAAERAMAEAEILSKNRAAESVRKAIGKLEEAIANYRAIRNLRGEAAALNLMGQMNRVLGNSRKAIELYNQALPLFRTSNDRLGEGEALNNLATAHYALGQIEEALDLYNRALTTIREVGDLQGEVSALNNIGSVYWANGDALAALDYYNQTLPLRHTLKDQNGLARTLNNIGTAWSDLGNPQKALESYLQALPLRQEAGDKSGEANTLGNIGLIYLGMGETERSLDYNQRALQLRQDAKNRPGLGYTLRNLGLIYSSIGDHQKALDYGQQALTIFREVGDRRGEAQVLNLTGLSYFNLDDNQKSLDLHNQSLSVFRAVGDRRGEAESLFATGMAYAKSEEWDRAIDSYRQALAIQKAINFLAGEAQTLLGIARVERNRANLIEARRLAQTAIEIIESLRARVIVEGLRASYFAANSEFYEFYIDLLMAMHDSHPNDGYDKEAFEISERARARSLLDLLTEARANIHQGVDAGLLAEEQRLQQQINAKEAYRIRLINDKRADQRRSKSEKELQDLLAQYENLQAQIRARSPRYADLTGTTSVSLKDIQQLLDDDTLILEYAPGPDRSFLWVVSKTTIKNFKLPSRNVIDSAARRVYELLAVSHRRQRKREAERATEELSQMLIGPAADMLGKKRLLIVADGVLQYIPFAALPAPTSQKRVESRESRVQSQKHIKTLDSRLQTSDSRLPLIIDHEIINLPSASVLAVLRREFANRKPAGKMVAVFADPVLDGNDIRVRQARVERENHKSSTASADQTIASADVMRYATDSGFSSLERLPFTRQEADAIAALTLQSQSFKALDFKASREAATNPELSQYRIVHFATHGLMNSQHPELSGIVLSLVDERGENLDGFLRAHDIYNMKLGAELVVLSACQTALGKEVRGEGLMGLVRGFMYAGSPRVVASLWNVKDQATAELMKRFYGKMLKEGLRPAAALKAAQVEMWRDERWSAPYYWAGFVLQGEWR